MKIQSAEFVKSCSVLSSCPREPIPEVAFLGRSNVGKSSLLNAMLNRKGLAKTSGSPGKTRLINFFRVNHHFFFVDLPGYGFARVGKREKESWKTLVETYLTGRPLLKGVVLLVDSRVGVTPLDAVMGNWLETYGIRFLTVATKIDKIPRGRRLGVQRNMASALSPHSESALLMVSSKTREGIQELWKKIDQLIDRS